MLTIENPGPPIDAADLKHFEIIVGADLPHDYNAFLLKYNGGKPVPDAISVGGHDESIQVFYGLRRPIESSRLDWNLKILSNRIEQLGGGYLPIACDSFGNDFLISLRDIDKGAVYLCDLQSVFADYDAVPKIYPIAPSFGQFLNCLHEFGTRE